MDRILVIDDEPMLLDLLEAYLEDKYIVDTAGDGLAGLRKIQAQEYDLIITGIKMPGFSGHQLLDYVKNIEHCATPVIGISGMPRLFGNSPFDAVLAKPFATQQLLDVVVDLTMKADLN